MRRKKDLLNNKEYGPMWYEALSHGNTNSSMIPIPENYWDAKFIVIMLLICWLLSSF